MLNVILWIQITGAGQPMVLKGLSWAPPVSSDYQLLVQPHYLQGNVKWKHQVLVALYLDGAKYDS